MENSITRHPASIKDPSSVVFFDDKGRIFRNLSLGKEVYNSFDFFPKVKNQVSGSLFEVEAIPFVNYYYEWGFEQFKDAALFYLDVLEKVIKKGYTLSDGTPLNIAYLGNGKFSFFDHGSLIQQSDNVWPSYFQFIREFVYPLVYSAYHKIEVPNQLLPLLNNNLWQTEYKPSGFSKYGLGFNVLRSNLKILSRPQKDSTFLSDNLDEQKKIIQRTIPFFRNYILGLNRKKSVSKWSDYYDNTVIKNGYVDSKIEAVKSLIAKIKGDVSCCIDLGASSGLFPKEITKYFGELTYIALESDPNAYNDLYSSSKRNQFIPVFANLLQVTPAAGINQGYTSLKGRLAEQGDLILALGIIHHMMHEGGMSFEELFKYFSSVSKPKSYLIVEYISPEDEKYKIIRNAKYPFDEDILSFEKALTKQFSIVEKNQVYETRWLFLGKKN